MGWFKLLKLKIQPKPNPTQALKKKNYNPIQLINPWKNNQRCRVDGLNVNTYL